MTVTLNERSSANTDAVLKLTALWAFSESGLGGILHALHIPFKGLLIAAIAVVLLSLIAKYSGYRYKQIIASTVIVIMVKAAVSPHSPLPAYLAVSFQGFMAAVLLGLFPAKKVMLIIFGTLALIETAAQKFIVLTLFFGKSFWNAANGLLKDIAQDLSMKPADNYAFWFLTIYLAIYGLWGALVGIYASGMSRRIEKHRDKILSKLNKLKHERLLLPTAVRKRNKKMRRLVLYLFILIVIVVAFVSAGAGAKKILMIVLRTLAAVAVMLLIVLPLFRLLFKKWLGNRSESELEKSRQVLAMLPQMRNHLSDAYTITKSERNVIRRLSLFFITMLILVLDENHEHRQHISDLTDS